MLSLHHDDCDGENSDDFDDSDDGDDDNSHVFNSVL